MTGVSDILLRVNHGDALGIAWGGVVRQEAGTCLKRFGGTECCCLLFVNRGVLSVRVNDEPLDVAKGQTLLVLPYEPCKGDRPHTSELVFQWIAFEVKRRTSEAGESQIQVPRIATRPDPERLTELFRLIIEEYHDHQAHLEKPERLSTMGSQHLLMSLLARLDPSEQGKPIAADAAAVLAERARDYIRENARKPITTDDISSALDCSPGYLRAAFRKTYGESPRDYILRVRLSIARDDLAKSRMSIGHIAQTCGFANLNYFTRIFTRHEGITPSAYRIAHSHQYVTPAV